MRSPLPLALALMAGTPVAAQVDVDTRGQAELVARRFAFDEAVADLRSELGRLHVGERMTLTAWLASRPDESLRVEQALRDADVERDEADGGRWHVALALSAAEINAALEGALRRGVDESSTTRLAGEGTAPIPWGRDSAAAISPSGSPAPDPTPGRSAGQRDTEDALWAGRAEVSATGAGLSIEEARRDARRRLASMLRELPAASPGTVGDWADASGSNRAFLDEMIQGALEILGLTADGRQTVTLRVSLDPLRRALQSQEVVP